MRRCPKGHGAGPPLPTNLRSVPGEGWGEVNSAARPLPLGAPLTHCPSPGVRRGLLASLLLGAGATLLLALLAAGAWAQGRAAQKVPPSLEGVRIEQKLDAQVPLDLHFLDETGKDVRLGDYFGRKPIILTLVYYRCPMLCTQVLNGLVSALQGMPGFEVGDKFEIVTVSFDPRDTPAVSAEKKKNYLLSYGDEKAGAGWHFLTGQQEAITRLAESVGFFYRFDPTSGQFAHASAIMILTPDGKVSRYYYGIKYRPRDVRLGLVEASAGKIGTPVDEIFLYCFHYDPDTGKYTASVMAIVRLGGVLTLVGLAALWFGLWRSGRRGARGPAADAEPPHENHHPPG
jgi:protein SCO1